MIDVHVQNLDRMDDATKAAVAKLIKCAINHFYPEHSADRPASGLSGRTTGSEAKRSGAEDQAGDLEGNSRVPRRSEAEPRNNMLTVSGGREKTNAN